MRTLIYGSGPWITMVGGGNGPRSGQALEDVGEQRGFALVAESGRIKKTGTRAELLRENPGIQEIDLGTRVVVPGFVDPHTHPVFAKNRADEFELRCRGKTYEEIAKAGGGIRNSARRLRGLSEEALTADLLLRADGFLLHGTTTIEAKSGYGLSTESEINSLRAIRNAHSTHPLDFEPTFLGAHEVPDEYRGNREGYLRLIEDEMLPLVVSEKLAVACDVFCEEHVFSIAESRHLLERAKSLGLKVKLHADEIRPTGGAELAAEVKALSADHLVMISDAGMEQMREAGVIPILLPGTSLFLNLKQDAPGRTMIERGLAPALATDFNPGSCPTRNLSLMMSLACIKYGMTARGALTAATWNAAQALGRSDVGILREGALADLVALDIEDIRELPYRMGENVVHTVIKRGVVVVQAFALCRREFASASRKNRG